MSHILILKDAIYVYLMRYVLFELISSRYIGLQQRYKLLFAKCCKLIEGILFEAVLI